MKFFTATALLLTLNASAAFSAEYPSCRMAVVEASAALGAPLEPYSFSTASPSEFPMSPREFNSLSPEEQTKLYYEYMPLEAMISRMREDINGRIDSLASSPFAQYFYVDELQELRARRDALVDCL